MLNEQCSLLGLLARLCPCLKQNYYLFKSWLREISFGKFMTILDLWCLIAKSCKNFTGGKENVSAIAVEIIKVTKTLIVQAMSSPFSWIWAIDNVSKFWLHLKEFYWLSSWQIFWHLSILDVMCIFLWTFIFSHMQLYVPKWAWLHFYISIGLLVSYFRVLVHLTFKMDFCINLPIFRSSTL